MVILRGYSAGGDEGQGWHPVGLGGGLAGWLAGKPGSVAALIYVLADIKAPLH